MGANLQRALLLFEQSRHDLAEQELRRELASEPNDPVAHALLGLCLSEAERYPEATREAEAAIGLAPDLPFVHYALARVLLDRERPDEAEARIQEAIRLDPEDPDYWATLARIRYGQRRWRDTLEAADRGLRVDPEHAGCTNLRAMALVQLGEREAAGAAIEGALARDPENALTHANEGWRLLHQADHGRAMEHFREALRLDPQLEWARLGLVEALKAHYPVYGLLLRYFLWISRLSGRAKWAVAIGGVVGYRFLGATVRATPDLAPVIWPIMAAYMVFVVSTWLADPLFNLLLRLNRFGRLVLSREEVVASNWVGGTVAVALVLVIAWLPTQEPTFLLGALAFGALAVPVAGVFKCEPGWPRRVMAGYAGVLAGLALFGLLLLGASLGLGTGAGGATGFLGLALLGGILGSWLAAGLSTVQPKH